MRPKPVVLFILDGWGHSDVKDHNGIALAHKPYFDSLLKNYPHTLIDGSGPAVGLPKGIMGNSEVGHMNLGAGRIVFSGLSQIYQAIEDKSFFTNEALMQAIQHAKSQNGTLHLMGLLSDGAVHSHQDHLYALIQMAKDNGLQNVLIHCFMDGRDTPPQDGFHYIEQLQNKIDQLGCGQIASISGRYFAMDRDQRWDRVEKAFRVITGQSFSGEKDPKEVMQSSYQNNKGDEFVEPVQCVDFKMTADDSVIFFNFRADRARQMSRVLTQSDFKEFDQSTELPGAFVCMSPYDQSLGLPVAFLPSYPTQTFGELVSKQNLKQLRIAETEKYAHVTFFFNGGQDQVFEGEDRALIPSPKEVATYDLKPEMSAYKVKDELMQRIKTNEYDVVICNFANTDMVGHTAKKEAILKAVQTVDDCLSELVPQILSQGGVAVITADHGNAEQMIDDSGEPMTAHTTNLVPFIVASDSLRGTHLKSGGRLCDVIPTLMQIMELDQPQVMTGVSLLES